MQGPQSETPCQEVRPGMLGSSYPRAAKDQQQLQAFLSSPLIGVQGPLSPPSGSSSRNLEELGFLPLLT